jgi:hypothetical protein
MDIFIRLFEEVAAIPAFSRHLSMTRVEIRHHFSSISMEDLCKDVGYMVLYLCTLQFNVRLVFLCNLLAFALQVRALGESSGVMGDCGRLLTEVLAHHSGEYVFVEYRIFKQKTSALHVAFRRRIYK